MGGELDGAKHHGMHLLEHLMFHETAPSKTRSMYLDQRGLGIKSQGWTSQQSMGAYFHGPTRHRKKILDYAALAASNNDFSKTEFRVEKNVLLREVPQLWSEDIWTKMQVLLDAALHPDSPYGITHAAELDGLRSLRLTDVQRLHRKAFSPDNMVLITVSPMNGSELERSVHERFVPLVGDAPQPVVYKSRLPSDKVFTTEQPGITTSFVRHALLGGRPSLKKEATLTVLDEVLRGHDSSLLFSEMRLRDGRVYSPRTNLHGIRPQAEIALFYSCLPKDIEFNLRRVRDVMERLADKPLPQSMVGDFKRYACAEFRNQMRDDESRIDFFAANASDGRFTTPAQFSRFLQDVSPARIQKLARTFADNLYTLVVYPSGEAKKPSL